MANIGLSELLIIALIIILLFGGKKIPEFFRGIGEAIREFRKATKDTDKE
jgi:sec-independent protein translocase protein TatA